MIEKMNLPYQMNALEPYYSTETLKIHYEELYKGYVDNTNKTLRKLEEARNSGNLENIKCLEKDLTFYGSGAILHELFFENMGPAVSSSISQNLLNQINKDFGSFDKFIAQFKESAKTVEASGWNLVVWVPRFNRLEIIQCEKHQDLTLWGCIPVIVLDMWEHSYFLQYKANRGEYINSFFNIINWNIVNARWNYIMFAR